MKVFVACIGTIKEALEPIGVYTTYERARTVAERCHSPEFQEFNVMTFEVDDDKSPSPDGSKADG